MKRMAEKKCRKAQLKIQEMAFVLIGIMIFFAMVALVYFSIRLSGLKSDVALQREDEAMQLAKKMTGTPEFFWAGCAGCLDLDKIFALKERKSYSNFWNLDYLAFEITYPIRAKSECTKSNYPDCTTITIVNNTKFYGTPASSFAALCWFEPGKGGYIKCGLGKIYAGAKAVE